MCYSKSRRGLDIDPLVIEERIMRLEHQAELLRISPYAFALLLLSVKLQRFSTITSKERIRYGAYKPSLQWDYPNLLMSVKGLPDIMRQTKAKISLCTLKGFQRKM